MNIQSNPDIGQASQNTGIGVVLVTTDKNLEETARAAYPPSGSANLHVLPASFEQVADRLPSLPCSVIIVDVDARRTDQVDALRRLSENLSPDVSVLVVTQQVDQAFARSLLQIQVADFLVKPVDRDDLMLAFSRTARETETAAPGESRIYTFLPSAGGVGVTTLAIQTAFLLHHKAKQTGKTTCIVDLNLQHGACADYLDLPPQLDLTEIEPRPERLDRQLLEVMLARHTSGLALVAAPNRPAEMHSFDSGLVTHLLDLVSAHFDSVIIDMPRTWFPWTDNVLLGTNDLFVVSEMTVPGMRNSQRLVNAIRQRVGDRVQPRVIVNRFEQHMMKAGLRRGDIVGALGDDFAGTVVNEYALVREAIDQGVPLDELKPGNRVTRDMRKIILGEAQAAKQKKRWFALPGLGGLGGRAMRPVTQG